MHANVKVGVSPVIGVAAATRLARAHPHGQLVLEALEQPVERVGVHHQRAQPHVDEGEGERECHLVRLGLGQDQRITQLRVGRRWEFHQATPDPDPNQGRERHLVRVRVRIGQG